MTSESAKRHFPEGFLWGTALASYQIEGGWNLGGITGDVACDSYHNYQHDVTLMKQPGATSYRMSVSWSRIIPDPLIGAVNQEGVAYYNRVIDNLLANGISPCLTLYHWEFPLVLEETVGGWPKEDVIPYFVSYAEACFQAFGDIG
ncbi:hypothetical protein ACOMHN_061006 [Nucella lapillus]